MIPPVPTFKDPRQISCISSEQFHYKLHYDHVTDIRPYEEGGEMGYILWFAVYHDKEDFPKVRINGKFVTAVEYNGHIRMPDDQDLPF